MKTDTDTSLLDDALGAVSGQARHYALDSLACYLHNTGYALQGNTEMSDVEWFARRLWERDTGGYGIGWDRAPAETKVQWRNVAGAVIKAIPDYQMRVANRLIELSKVVRDIERSERSATRSGLRAPNTNQESK